MHKLFFWASDPPPPVEVTVATKPWPELGSGGVNGAARGPGPPLPRPRYAPPHPLCKRRPNSKTKRSPRPTTSVSGRWSRKKNDTFGTRSLAMSPVHRVSGSRVQHGASTSCPALRLACFCPWGGGVAQGLGIVARAVDQVGGVMRTQRSERRHTQCGARTPPPHRPLSKQR